MSSVGFTLREGWRSFRRGGLAGALALVALLILAAMIALAGGIRDSLAEARARLLTRFEVEAFLVPGMENQLATVAERMRQRPGVVEVDTVSKHAAALRFAEQHGEDVLDLLEENPLPASVIIRYRPEAVSSDGLLAETQAIAADEAIDDVTWDGELLSRFEALSTNVIWGLAGFGLVLLLVAVGLTLQSVRVAARTGRAWARTVFLVGGTLGQIRAVLAVGGLITGLFGGVIGAAGMGGLQWYLSSSPWVATPDPFVLLLAAVVPVLVGVLGAMRAWPREMGSAVS